MQQTAMKRAISILGLLLLLTTTVEAATFSHLVTGTWTTGTSFTVTPSPATTSGNVLVLWIATEAVTAPTVTSISDGTANTWVQLKGLASASRDAEIWYTNGTNVVSGAITINLSATPLAASTDFGEFSGMSSVSADKTASKDGAASSTLITNNTATTTQAVELCLAAYCQLSNTSTLSSPVAESGSHAATWHLVNSGTPAGTLATLGGTYADVAATGAYGCQVSSSKLSQYIGVIGTLKYTAATPTRHWWY